MPRFLPAWLLGFSSFLYSAVEVDATTNRRLASVHVRANEVGTDALGCSTLPDSPQPLDLSLLGYYPLRVAVPAHPGTFYSFLVR
jgi:hypothetical protein